MDEAIIPFSKKTWSEIIFEKLKQLIEDGYWKPEEKIYTEAELCGKFNVSRAPVREAINMLKANNLVYVVPGAGTFVSRQTSIVFSNEFQLDLTSEQSLLEVMEFRLAVEPYSAFLAAARMPEEDITRLDALHKKYAAGPVNDPKFFAETDMELHLLIARCSRNELIVQAMTNVKSCLRSLLVTSNDVFGHREIAVSFHARLVDSIARRDSEAAEQAMREHLGESFEFIRSIISTVKKTSQRITAGTAAE